jgi:probable rRNA maturation factor
LALCADVIAREAEEQSKPVEAHWAHMVIHGCLHLLGLDHQTDTEAAQMEAREIALLAKLGFANPYQIIDDSPQANRSNNTRT